MALTPGVYGDIIVNSGTKLILESGQYFVKSFSLQSGAELYVGSIKKERTDLFCKGNIDIRGKLSGFKRSNDFGIFTYGQSVVLNTGMKFDLVAPNALVEVYDTYNYGQIVAKNLIAHQGNVIIKELK